MERAEESLRQGKEAAEKEEEIVAAKKFLGRSMRFSTRPHREPRGVHYFRVSLSRGVGSGAQVVNIGHN
jgi:hypothetical protein